MSLTDIKVAGKRNPKVRYVYLVSDLSDAARMGGTAENTYTTFQTAYNAANTLQIALGGSNIVEIVVGNTITAVSVFGVPSTTVGNLTLTAAYNHFVRICGQGPNVSLVGTIIATNAAGNGFDVGTSTAFSFQASNVRIGSTGTTINTTTTGATGNGGRVIALLNNVITSNITSGATNGANTLGIGGLVSLDCRVGTSSIGNINGGTSNVGGNISVSGRGVFGNLATLGTVAVGEGATVGTITQGSLTISGAITPRYDRCTIGSMNFTGNGGSSLYINQCNIGTININHNEITLTAINIYARDTRFTSLTCAQVSPLDLSLFNSELRDCIVEINGSSGITNLGNNSLLTNCTFDVYLMNFTVGVIERFGSGCKMFNCDFTIHTSGASAPAYSVNNQGVVETLLVKNCTFALGNTGYVDGNTQLVELPQNIYTSSITPTVHIDPSTDDITTILLDTVGVTFEMGIPSFAPGCIGNPIIGREYTIVVINQLAGVGGMVFSWGAGSTYSQTGVSGNFPITAGIGAIDIFKFTYDGVSNIYVDYKPAYIP